MFSNDINLNQVRVFESVHRNRSMTQAAKELHLTQSGVSQHMAALEETLGLRLFDRIQGRLLPTTPAHELYEHALNSLKELTRAVERLRGGEGQLDGRLTIAYPSEFGLNVVIPQLARFCRDNPRVRIQTRSELTGAINATLIQGDVDFAFVDEGALDRRIEVERVHDEILDLCVHANRMSVGLPSPADLAVMVESLDFVDYDPDGTILSRWMRHHLGRLPAARAVQRIKAVLPSAQGVARLILEGLGAGVLPDHLADRLIREGRPLHRIRLAQKPLHNQISLASLKGRTHSRVARAAMEWFKQEFGVKNGHAPAKTPTL